MDPVKKIKKLAEELESVMDSSVVDDSEVSSILDDIGAQLGEIEDMMWPEGGRP